MMKPKTKSNSMEVGIHQGEYPKESDMNRTVFLEGRDIVKRDWITSKEINALLEQHDKSLPFRLRAEVVEILDDEMIEFNICTFELFINKLIRTGISPWGVDIYSSGIRGNIGLKGGGGETGLDGGLDSEGGTGGVGKTGGVGGDGIGNRGGFICIFSELIFRENSNNEKCSQLLVSSQSGIGGYGGIGGRGGSGGRGGDSHTRLVGCTGGCGGCGGSGGRGGNGGISSETIMIQVPKVMDEQIVLKLESSSGRGGPGGYGGPGGAGGFGLGGLQGKTGDSGETGMEGAQGAEGRSAPLEKFFI